jgi:5-(carboxyamino)imidazole ribonucleotide synthase
VHIYAPEEDSVAAEVCAAFTQAAWDDAKAMRAFAADCAVVTYEFENVPVGPLAAIAPHLCWPRPARWKWRRTG